MRRASVNEVAIVEPGIYEMPVSVYQADPCPEPSLRSSMAWKLIAPGSTPAHAVHGCKRLNPSYEEPPKKKFLDVGTAAHQMLLGRGAGYKVIKAEDYRTKSARMARETVYNLGATPLLEHEEKEIQAMVSAARRQIRDLIDFGTLEGNPFEHPETERVLIWREDNGVWCRAALDGLSLDGECINEFKTEGESADPQYWQFKARKMGYIMRLCFYARGLEKLKIGYSPALRFFVLETKPPHLMSMIRIDDELIAKEMERVRQAIKLYGDCLRSGRWPGYDPAGYDLGLTEREKMQIAQAEQYNGHGHIDSADIS